MEVNRGSTGSEMTISERKSEDRLYHVSMVVAQRGGVTERTLFGRKGTKPIMRPNGGHHGLHNGRH